jgi:hypothetical protein
LTAWRDRTAAKQAAEQQRRLAVRHFYLSTLGRVVRGWRLAGEAAANKQQLLAAARQRYNSRLLAAVMQVRMCLASVVQ